MQEFGTTLNQMGVQVRQFNQQMRMFRVQQQTAESQERIRAMQWNSSAYYAPPVSLSCSTSLSPSLSLL